MASARIYLTGSVAIENGESFVADGAFPGRQGRLAFAFLTVNAGRPVGRAAVMDVIWPDEAPPEADAALSAILSKLRAVLKKAGWTSSEAAIDVRSGSLAIRFPHGTWFDVEAAASAVDEAEGARRAGRAADAWASANVVVSIARRPFLAGHEEPWVVGQRDRLRTLLRRGLECLAAVSGSHGEPTLAVQYLTEVRTLEPFRETTYQQLMRLHAGLGNRAEALRVFDECRRLLRDELGTSPSPQTEATFLEILRNGTPRRRDTEIN